MNPKTILGTLKKPKKPCEMLRNFKQSHKILFFKGQNQNIFDISWVLNVAG